MRLIDAERFKRIVAGCALEHGHEREAMKIIEMIDLLDTTTGSAGREGRWLRTGNRKAAQALKPSPLREIP